MSDDSDAGSDADGVEQVRVEKPEITGDTRAEMARDLLVAYRVPLTLVGLAVGTYAVYSGLLPSQLNIPPEYWRYVSQYFISLAVAYVPAKEAANWLDQDTRIALHELDPASGDYRVALISENRWKDLTVLDKRGREVNRSKLYQPAVQSGRESYECQWYDIESNTAVVSFMAGFSPTQLRRYEQSLMRVEEEVAAKSAKYDDVTANLRLVVRNAAHREYNQFIHAYDGLMQIDETSMKDNLEAAQEQYGVNKADLESVVEDVVDVEDPRVKYGDKEPPGSDDTAYSFDAGGGGEE
ncbi:hypothetical protein ACFQE1_01725 [Halobium palmae]|uniref:Uncharacterized protein n=1 Tax=Halobium palmae TaxID=1776492 RepID=A0ABD5RUP3_9EURY